MMRDFRTFDVIPLSVVLGALIIVNWDAGTAYSLRIAAFSSRDGQWRVVM